MTAGHPPLSLPRPKPPKLPNPHPPRALPVPERRKTTLDPSVNMTRIPWFFDTLPSIGSVYSKSSMPEDTCRAASGGGRRARDKGKGQGGGRRAECREGSRMLLSWMLRAFIFLIVGPNGRGGGGSNRANRWGHLKKFSHKTVLAR